MNLGDDRILIDLSRQVDRVHGDPRNEPGER
jgi:hypothetical protein